MLKKITVLYIVIAFSLVSCFRDDESQISITVNKGSFTGEYVHVGAFSNDEVVAQISFKNISGVKVDPIYVPSNEKLIFVIVGEESGFITYHAEKEVDVTGDSNQVVTIDLLDIPEIYGDNEGGINLTKNGNEISWHDFAGADEYELKYDTGSGFDVFYTGKDVNTVTPYPSGAADEHYLTIRFGFVDKETNSLYGIGF